VCSCTGRKTNALVCALLYHCSIGRKKTEVQQKGGSGALAAAWIFGEDGAWKNRIGAGTVLLCFFYKEVVERTKRK
jgi:hypothetical protein